MSAPVSCPVERHGVFTVGPAKRSRKPRLVLRNGNQMNVIGHQAKCLNRNARGRTMTHKQPNISGVVSRGKENLLTVVSPLRDMVRDPWKYAAGTTRHNHSVPLLGKNLKKLISPPFPLRY